jgi:hypothetical protein
MLPVYSTDTSISLEASPVMRFEVAQLAMVMNTIVCHPT